MAAAWTMNDRKIILKLRQRYLETQSLGLSIVMFDELSIILKMKLFIDLELDEPPRSTQQRIV